MPGTWPLGLLRVKPGVKSRVAGPGEVRPAAAQLPPGTCSCVRRSVKTWLERDCIIRSYLVNKTCVNACTCQAYIYMQVIIHVKDLSMYKENMEG